MIYLSARQFKLGRKAGDPNKPRLRLSRFLSDTAPTYPENRDYISKVANWPMYLNDRLGDCTCATVGHTIQVLTTYGQGQTVAVSDNDVLTAYEAVSGYNPNTGANDDGAVVQDVLNYWRKTGVGGHNILAFAYVEPSNTEELFAAMNLFGTIYLGIDFPNTAFDQLDAGEPWDVVDGAVSEGGHAINAAYYDVSDKMWKVITWGQVQPMTQAFWDKYVDEAWVVISHEWFNAQGNSPTGINMYALGEEFRSLTGESNPFPEPAPEPTPEPAPTPVDPDSDLAKAAHGFLNRNPAHHKALQNALREWLDAKGL